MNPNNFNHRQQQRTGMDHQAALRSDAAREFGTAEELLRHDAAQIRPSAEVAARLGRSVQGEAPPLPWWKRIFHREF
jgi:hypothetical protein